MIAIQLNVQNSVKWIQFATRSSPLLNLDVANNPVSSHSKATDSQTMVKYTFLQMALQALEINIKARQENDDQQTISAFHQRPTIL